MALIVQKFGGTSLGTPERIRAVASRIASAHHEKHQLVVVVSAMGNTTDELIDLAHQVSKNPPHREMDMLLTSGERISMALLSMALAQEKIPALSFTGSQTGIITDSSHRRARIRRILGDRIRSTLSLGKVAIVAGFQGVSETKEITTLGRGGSDTSAVALASVLNADSCEIYTDVDGIYSGDPRLVSQAHLWKRIPYSLMVEMSHRGAGVLHPRCVEMAKRFSVQLKVKNSLNDHEGTSVISDSAAQLGMEDFSVVGVTHDVGRFFLTVKLSRPTVLQALWHRAAEAHLSILAPSFDPEKVVFFSDREVEQEWRKVLEELSREGYVKEYHLDLDLVPISIVGNRFSQDSRALAEVLDILGRDSIPIRVGSASPLVITVGVSSHRAEEGVQALHRHFLEKK